MKKIILFILFFTLLEGKSQSIKNLSDFDFIVDKIRHVYAGYKEKEKEFEKLVNALRAKNDKDTFYALSKITLPFNDNHLKLYQPYFTNKIDTILSKQNLSSIKIPKNKHEGYWIDDYNSLIIYLKKINPKEYEGYIVESKKEVLIGLCILKMKSNLGKAFTTDIVDINEWFRVIVKSNFKSDKVLLCNSYGKWKKITNYQKGMLNELKDIEYKPSFSRLDSNNVLIEMPSFGRNKIQIYDSIINKNVHIIKETKNLIIDIRNNGGGVINNFFSLLPFVCTNKIMTPSSYRYCSEDVINDTRKNFNKFLKLGDTVKSKRYDSYLKLIEGKKDSFLYYPSDKIIECQSDSFPTIKNIAIITNNACLSAAELMLLYFRQSRKVKTFGEVTGGAVDFLDTNRYTTPSTKYNLFVPTTKREITKDFPSYDRTGIKPDIEISDEIIDWVDFVKKYYEKN